MMTHPPEELLIQHVFGLTDIQDHLRECAECDQTAHLIRESTASAGPTEPPAWLAQLDEETAHQRAVGQELLEQTSDEQLTESIDERLLTSGGVSAVLQRLAEVRRREPITAMAIANQLLASSRDLGNELKVDLLREAGTTARAMGAYESALDFLASAESSAAELPVGDFALARVWFERARVAIDQEHPREAREWASRSAEVFQRFGDERRYQRARYLQAVTHYYDRNYQQTIDDLTSLIPSLETASDRETVALSWSMIGHSAVSENQLKIAQDAFARAVELFNELGWTVERLRAEWGTIRLLIKTTRFDDAIDLASTVQRGFEELGLTEEAGLVGLDLTEVLLLTGESEKARAVCSQSLSILTDLLSSPDEQRALAYLREAAMTAPAVSAVSTFLREFREFPTTRFSPPPA